MKIYKGSFDDFERGIGISFSRYEGEFTSLDINLWKYYISFCNEVGIKNLGM